MKMPSVLLVLALAAVPAARAQSPAPALSSSSGPALTVEDCLKLATEKQPALAAAQAGVAAAAAAVGEAHAPYYPSVDLNAGYHRWQRRAFLPSGLVLPGGHLPELIGPLDDWTGGVSSRVTLYDFGERRAGLDAAVARRAAAAADAVAAQADVRLSVQTAFYTLAAAEDMQVVAEKNLDRTQRHLHLAEARRQSGAVPQADVLRMQAEVASADLQVISARSRVRIATGRLNTAIGRPAETPLAIATPAVAPPPADAIDPAAAADRALAHRPELASAEKRAEAAKSGVAAARAARTPKLRADGSYGWNDTGFLPGTREWQAGLSIDLPVFDGGSRAHRLARSRAEQAREESRLEAQRLQVRQEVWTAAAELDRTWASIAANETAVKASEESLRVVQERYESGAAVITDLLDTQTALARAEASLAGARWDYLAARAAYDRAVGGNAQ